MWHRSIFLGGRLDCGQENCREMSRRHFCVLWSSDGPPSFSEVLAADSPVSAAAEDGGDSHLKPYYPVSCLTHLPTLVEWKPVKMSVNDEAWSLGVVPLTSIRAYPAQEPCAHKLLPWEPWVWLNSCFSLFSFDNSLTKLSVHEELGYVRWAALKAVSCVEIAE